MDDKDYKTPFSVMDHPKWKFEILAQVELPVQEPSNSEIAEFDVRDAAYDRVSTALIKLGITEADIELVLGIEPSTKRKAKKPKKGNQGKSAKNN
jgi:hypothetical protein